MGTPGFEPGSAGLEPAILARLYYIPLYGKNSEGVYKGYSDNYLKRENTKRGMYGPHQFIYGVLHDIYVISSTKSM